MIGIHRPSKGGIHFSLREPSRADRKRPRPAILDSLPFSPSFAIIFVIVWAAIKWTSVKQTYTKRGAGCIRGQTFASWANVCSPGPPPRDARPLVMHVLRGSANFRWNPGRPRFWLHCYKVNWWFVALASPPPPVELFMRHQWKRGRKGEKQDERKGRVVSFFLFFGKLFVGYVEADLIRIEL